MFTNLTLYVALTIAQNSFVASVEAPATPPAVDESPAEVATVITDDSLHDQADAPVVLSLIPGVPLRVAAAPSANEIVDKVQAFYKKTNRLSAKFRQTYTNKTFGKTSVSDGRVWIKKPGKMRWDYNAKARKGKKPTVRKSFISDGTTLWAVEHANKQIMKQDLKESMLPVAVTFLYGKGDLKRDFKAAIDSSGTYGSRSDLVVALTPKTPSAQYKTLYLVVDKSNYRVKQSIVHEASGNVNHFRFYEPNTSKAVKDAWFVFNVKAHPTYRLVQPKR